MAKGARRIVAAQLFMLLGTCLSYEMQDRSRPFKSVVSVLPRVAGRLFGICVALLCYGKGASGLTGMQGCGRI